VHGETGNYLRPAPGQATLNVVEMAREGLQLELRTALHAASQGAATLGREVPVKTNGEPRTISLSVRPLPDPAGHQGLLLVSFKDVVRPVAEKPKGKRRADSPVEARRIAQLEHDLAYTRENLQSTIEEQQASNEELKSTNEELQSTNEELQSTNEELETSKEEMQSVNEELITVNAELQSKIEQLTGMQNDMKNLLDNIDIGAIFLDRHLAIRRFTREATRVYRLVATDVNRPLADIRSNLTGDDDLLAAAQAVLDTLLPFEREVHVGDASYLARIQPYRTLDNVIDGVVLTLADISNRIEAVQSERRTRKLAESIVDTVRESLLVLDADLKVITASRSFYRRFQTVPGDTIGRPIYELGNGQWNIPALRELLETILPRDESFDGFAVEHDFLGIGRHKMLLNARRVVSEPGDKPLILLAIENN
jgi:two-component system CheB/CheR fusion protein